MKKIYILTILISLLAVSFFTGCSLDEDSIRTPVADTYYKTEEGAKDLVNNSCYSYTRRIYGRYESWALNVQGTDLFLPGGDGEAQWGRYEMVPSAGFLKTYWDNCFLGITACNTLLSRAEEIEASADVVNGFRGEVLFLRALYYHLLVINFGGVPLKTEEVTSVETTAIRASEEDVYALIIDDLLESEKLLPQTQAEYGRATQAAAQALLARVYLWTKQYANAATYAKKVIGGGQFQLLSDYADLWRVDNQKNAEVIWSVQYTQDVLLNGSGNIGNCIFLMRYDIRPGLLRSMEYGRPFRHHMPSRYFLNLLHANQWWDSRFDKAYTYQWNANNEANLLPEMTLGDTALFVPPYSVPEKVKEATQNKYTTYDIDYYFDASSPNGELPLGPREVFPSINKFMDPTRPAIPDPGTTDFVVFRLAEMYLIAAEALMMDNKANEGVEYINEVRKRAAWSEETYGKAKLTADQLTIDAILEERALELAGECVGRWADLKRTGKLIERVKLYNPDGRSKIQEIHLLRPIPQSMIDRVSNKDEFKQNPGY
jgi:hypothetical protein